MARNATRQRLAGEAVVEMLGFFSMDELLELLTWRGALYFSPPYAPHCARLRELTMLEVARRQFVSAIGDSGALPILPRL